MRVVLRFLFFAWPAVFLCACDPHAAHPSSVAPDAGIADVPLLTPTPGDAWIYQVRLRIPAGVTSATAAEVDTAYESVRTFLGKVSAGAGFPEADCFEVSVPGSPREREFVEMHPDRILIRGSLLMRPENPRSLWLDRPVTFVSAGMKAGDSLPDSVSMDGGIIRRTKVIGREDVTVPGGTFRCIRLLTTGSDGELDLRRTVWFAPGTGIVREEKSRYRRDRLVMREVRELMELRRKP
jgi:hypothetical protein